MKAEVARFEQKSFITDKKGAVILPFTKYEPGIVRNDEEKIPAAKAEKDVEDDEKGNEKIAEGEGVPSDVPVKNQDGLAAANVINYDDEVNKEDEDTYEDDENNENDEENVIEEMETIYNVSVANYFSPLMIPPSPPDIPVTTYSPIFIYLVCI